MLLNTRDAYGSLTRWLHWTIALLIIGLIIIGFSFHYMSRPERMFWMKLHKSFGISVLILMILRVVLKFFQFQPKLIKAPRWQQISARVSHGSLYFLAISMPLSGWIMSSAFGRATTWLPYVKIHFPFVQGQRLLGRYSHQFHITVAWIIAAIIIYTLAALKHHFINKDNTLVRMLRSKTSN